MPAHDIMQQSEFLYYECDERGLWIQLGEGKHVQFSQEAERPYLTQIRINSRDEEGGLVPIEEKWELARLLEKTNHFEKGRIRYVPSPEEVRARVRASDQQKACEDLKADLANGLLILPIDTMSEDAVLKLANKIGVPRHSAKTGRTVPLSAIRIAIAGKLGLSSSVPEVNEPAAEVVQEVPVFAEEAVSISQFVESSPPKRNVKKKGK